MSKKRLLFVSIALFLLLSAAFATISGGTTIHHRPTGRNFSASFANLNPVGEASNISGYVPTSSNGTSQHLPQFSHIYGNTSSLIYPSGVGYDPVTSSIYVSNYLGNNITVVNPSTDRVEGTIKGPPYESYLSVNDYTGNLIVGNSSNLYTLPGTSIIGSRNGNVLHFFPSIYVASDSLNGNYFVENGGNVDIVSHHTWNTLKSFQVTSTFFLFAFDPAKNLLVALTPINDTLKTYNASTGRVVTSTLLEAGLFSFDETTTNPIAFDNSGKIAFVGVNNLLEAVNLSTGKVVWKKAEPGLSGGALPNTLYDAFNNLVYYTAYNAGPAVGIVDGDTGNFLSWISLPGFGYLMAFDPINKGVYVTSAYEGIFGPPLSAGFIGVVNYTYEPFQKNQYNMFVNLPVLAVTLTSTTAVSFALLRKKFRIK